MLNFNKKMSEYIELKKQYDDLKKQLDDLKKEFIQDLKTRECSVNDKGQLCFEHPGKDHTAVLTITNTVTIDTALIKKMFPGEYEKAGTRENFNII